MGISSLGIGSGIDTAGMLEQLKAGEQMRLQPYTLKKSTYSGKISAWGQISSAMSDLQACIKKLKGDAFSKMTVSKNDAFTATAGSGATADTHSVTVHQLASAHKIKTKGFPSADDQLGQANGGTRKVTITTGDGKTTTVELKDDETSLSQIVVGVARRLAQAVDVGGEAVAERLTGGIVLGAVNTQAGREALNSGTQGCLRFV